MGYVQRCPQPFMLTCMLIASVSDASKRVPTCPDGQGFQFKLP